MFSNLRTPFPGFRSASDWFHGLPQMFWSIFDWWWWYWGSCESVSPSIKSLSMIESDFRLILFSRDNFYMLFSILRTPYPGFRSASDWFHGLLQMFWSIFDGWGWYWGCCESVSPSVKALSMIESDFRLILYSRDKFYVMFAILKTLFPGFRSATDWFHGLPQMFWSIFDGWGWYWGCCESVSPSIKTLSMIESDFRLIIYSRDNFDVMLSILKTIFPGFRSAFDWFHGLPQMFWIILDGWGWYWRCFESVSASIKALSMIESDFR